MGKYKITSSMELLGAVLGHKKQGAISSQCDE